MKKVLVIAAHPDDEILGCGGVMAKLASEGCTVEVVIAAEGITSRSSGKDNVDANAAVCELRRQCERANALLGVKKVYFLDFPDNKMDTIPMLDIVQRIESQIEYSKPDLIFTHHPSDLNIDHKILHNAVITATRPLPGQNVKEIYFFEVMSASGWHFGIQDTFRSQVFFDITSFLSLKLKALEVYKGEMREFPHARSLKAVEAQAVFRGGLAGQGAAEAFEVGRLLK